MQHKVQPGENIFLIAKKYKVALGGLAAANPQISHLEYIMPGQILNIPTDTGYETAPAVAENTYIVRSGDTLYTIALGFGISLQALIAANPQIENPDLIYPDQIIHIPGTPTAAGVSVSISVIGENMVLVPPRTVNVTNFDLRPYIGGNAQWGPDVLTEPTVAHAVIQALLEAGIDFEAVQYGWGLYFALINGLREMDITPTSGWLYSVDGFLPSVGSQAYLLQEGETIIWEFSLR